MRANLLFGALLPFLLTGAAPAPVALDPSGKWVLDYGAQRCTLWRQFGSGKHAARLVFEQIAPRREISVLLFGSAVPTLSGRANELSFPQLPGVIMANGGAVATSEDKENGVYWSGAILPGKWGLISIGAAKALASTLAAGESPPYSYASLRNAKFDWAATDWRREPKDVRDGERAAFDLRSATVQTLVLNPSKSRPLTLRVGSLKAPLSALEECSRQGLKHWGIDPAIEESVAVSAHPISDPSRLFSVKDYPQSAITKGMESRLTLWLNIDAAGAISSCRSVSSFASPEINAKMCGLFSKRAKFAPTRTAEGSAVPSYYVQTFAFILED